MSVVACLVTGRERAAISTIEVYGADASKVVAKGFTPATRRPIALDEIRYGSWHSPDPVEGNSLPGESVVVVSVSAPKAFGSSQVPSVARPKIETATNMAGQSFEIHCHGGEVAAARILDDLRALGAMVVGHAEWLSVCGADLLEQESTHTLARTMTTRTAAIALDQVRGTMRDFARRALNDVGTVGSDAIASIQTQVQSILRFADFGLHLTKPWSVVLAGAPNVGKSSLVNALVGYRRSITFDKPGTTRDVLNADIVIDGWPILLSDTAGIHLDCVDEVEGQGIERARAMLPSADLVVWVDDASDLRSQNNLFISEAPARLLRVVNKIDRANDPCADECWRLPLDSESMSPDFIQTSATTGFGIDRLRRSIAAKLIPELPEFGLPVPVSDRQIEVLQQILAADEVDSLKYSLRRLIGERTGSQRSQ